MKRTNTYPHHLFFITGAILLVIGAAISTFATFFIYFYGLPIIIFFLGVVLIWISKKGIRTKLLWTVTPIAIFFAYQYIWYQSHKVPPETFLIPQEFRGKVHVIFNKECGQQAEMVDNRRIYRIPTNGVLLSKFKDKQGFINQKYFLVEGSGKQTLLPQLDVRDYNEEWTIEKNPKEPSRNILGVFHAGRVSADGTYEFYVSSYQQLKDSFDFQYDNRFDSLESKLLGECENGKSNK